MAETPATRLDADEPQLRVSSLTEADFVTTVGRKVVMEADFVTTVGRKVVTGADFVTTLGP